MTPTDGAAALRIAGLSKSYGSVRAVDDVTLEVGPGAFFSLLGASGSGKSTLLRMIAGLEAPDSGRIWIGGIDVTDLPAYRRPVNTVFQSYALFPHLTVFDNVAYGLRREGLPRDEIAARVADALAVVAMERFARRRPNELSGGQQQRVAICRAIVKRPKLLLLDEPLAALDRRLREHTRFELKSLQERLGITFLMVTHDQEEAMSISGTLAVMDHGRIVQIGPPAEVYARPSNRSIADFIGDANLFAVRVVEVAASRVGLHLTAPDAAAELHGWTGTVAAGETRTLLLRPEQMRIERVDPGPGTNRIAGEVRGVSFLGSASVILVQAAAGPVIEVRSNGPAGVAAGDRIWTCWEPHSGVLLEPR